MAMTQKEIQARWRKKNPWRGAYDGARWRCKYQKSYKGRGIQSFLKLDQVKYLWFRDKAYLMKQPSLDRRNGKGNYEIGNCRFIEMEENREPQPIIMYKIFKSAGDASRYFGNGLAIICCCANKERRNKTYRGFNFMWLDDYLKLIKK